MQTLSKNPGYLVDVFIIVFKKSSLFQIWNQILKWTRGGEQSPGGLGGQQHPRSLLESAHQPVLDLRHSIPGKFCSRSTTNRSPFLWKFIWHVHMYTIKHWQVLLYVHPFHHGALKICLTLYSLFTTKWLNVSRTFLKPQTTPDYSTPRALNFTVWLTYKTVTGILQAIRYPNTARKRHYSTEKQKYLEHWTSSHHFQLAHTSEPISIACRISSQLQYRLFRLLIVLDIFPCAAYNDRPISHKSITCINECTVLISIFKHED